MSNPLKELHCYLRVSSEGQKTDGGSLNVQRNHGKKLSKKLGLKYVEVFEGSSSTMIRSEEDFYNSPRPQYRLLQDMIRDKRLINLWVWNKDRLHRDNLEEEFFNRFMIQEHKINFYYGEHGDLLRLDTPLDRMNNRFFSIISTYQKDNTSYLSRKGKQEKSRTEGSKGVFMGGTVNFGYTTKNKKFKKHPTESKYVKKMFEMYSRGESLKEIKTYFDTNGVKPRRSKLWSLGSLHKMLMNRVYIGEFIWVDRKSEEEFFITVPRIVTHSLFQKVQRKLTVNQKNKGSNSRKFDTLLDDFLVCYCGENITSHIKSTHGKIVKKYYYCHSKNNKWKGKKVDVCMNRRSMNMDETDKLVSETVREVVGDSNLLKERFKIDVLDKKSVDEDTIEVEKDKLQTSIDNINKELEVIIDSLSINEINHLTKKTETRVYKEVKKTLEEQRLVQEERKEQKVDEIEELDNQKDWVNWVTKYSDEINTSFSNITSDYLKGIVSNIEVSPKMGKNRDDEEKQVGHIMKINFKLPIVGDSIQYNDVKKKSKGYKLVNGKKSIKKEIGINVGGRKKK